MSKLAKQAAKYSKQTMSIVSSVSHMLFGKQQPLCRPAFFRSSLQWNLQCIVCVASVMRHEWIPGQNLREARALPRNEALAALGSAIVVAAKWRQKSITQAPSTSQHSVLLGPQRVRMSLSTGEGCQLLPQQAYLTRRLVESWSTIST